MKFELNDFLELDTKALLTVNGGTDCSSSPSGGWTNSNDSDSSDGPSGGNTPNGGGGSSGGSSSGGSGGSCGGSNGGKSGDNKNNNENSNNGYYNEKGDKVTSIPKGGALVHRSGDKEYTYTYNNPDGKGTNTVTYQKNSDGTWSVSSNYHYGVTSSGSNGTTTSATGSKIDTTGPATDSTGTITGTTSTTTGGHGYSTTTSGEHRHSTTTAGGTCGSGSSNGGSSTPANTETPDTPETPDAPTVVETGSFAQITDGSYADNLTMQYYKNGMIEIRPFGFGETLEMAKMHDLEMNGGYKFSEAGCKMTGTAKIVSEVTGKVYYLTDINKKVDSNRNGELTVDEITSGLNSILDNQYGDIYDVKGKTIDNPTLNNLQDIASDTSGTTYVLGKAADVHGSEHWVVLEGYTVKSDGSITFNYDGTSDNDARKNRSYVIGTSDTDNNIHNIVQIQAITIYQK